MTQTSTGDRLNQMWYDHLEMIPGAPVPCRQRQNHESIPKSRTDLIDFYSKKIKEEDVSETDEEALGV